MSLKEKKKLVTKHEFEKFRDVYKNHSCAPRSKLYLADEYDLMRVYTDGMNIKEKRVDKRRGVLILYALPDTVKLGLSEAQTYDVIWNTFHKIQHTAPTAMVYYGQETGEKDEPVSKASLKEKSLCYRQSGNDVSLLRNGSMACEKFHEHHVGMYGTDLHSRYRAYVHKLHLF